MELSNQKKTYLTSGNLIYSCQYHILFCSKWRRKVLNGQIAKHLQTLIEEKQEDFGFRLDSLDIQPDHVHLLLGISPELSVNAVVKKIKGHTSHVLRETYQELRSRIPTLWTRVSLISSVGNVALNDIETFLEDQRQR